MAYIFHIVLDTILLQVRRCLCSVKPLCGVQVRLLKVIPVDLQLVLQVRAQVHWWDWRTGNDSKKWTLNFTFFNLNYRLRFECVYLLRVTVKLQKLEGVFTAAGRLIFTVSRKKKQHFVSSLVLLNRHFFFRNRPRKCNINLYKLKGSIQNKRIIMTHMRKSNFSHQH